MPGHEDLVGGTDDAVLDSACLDVGHAVEAGQEDGGDGGGDCLYYDRASAALDAIETGDGELPQRGLEEENQNQRGLAQDHRTEKAYH